MVNRARTWELTRRRTDRVLGGVAGGLADSLGIPDSYVRAGFITLAAVWGLGAIVYLAMWLIAYDRVADREPEPVSADQALGLVVGFVGLMLLLGALDLWPHPVVVLTTTALAFGTAALTDKTTPRPLATLMDPGVDRPSRVRILIGVALLIAGLSVFVTAIGPIFELGAAFLAVVLTGLGVFVAFGPWVRRLLADLASERGERIRQEERAELAAHLHDSVLQTLALIQRSDDPSRMAMLARHQEGELRDWLYGRAPLDGIDLMSTALRSAASRVEGDHQVPIEVVTVGDAHLDDRLRATLAAATEAMVNAAKHSGSDRVSVYMEVDGPLLNVYVTDQGKGFDIAEIGTDRRGLAESIRGRVERTGGTVAINSDPGEGTEVILTVQVGNE